MSDDTFLPSVSSGRRRRRPVEAFPQTATGNELIVYGEDEANEEHSSYQNNNEGVAPSGIGRGKTFRQPWEEFRHWSAIKDEVLEEFVKRSVRPGWNPAMIRDNMQEYNQLVNDVAITYHPEWGIQPIQLERLIELLRIHQFGYGPLEDYMNIDGLEELYFNRFDKGFYIVRGTKYTIKDPVFPNPDALRQFVQTVARENGLAINTEKPNLDATLRDGSRLNATLEPLAVDGPDFVIRKHRDIPFTVEQYIKNGMMTIELAQDLENWIGKGLNIVVSGGTGSGKTSLLNCLGNTFVPSSDRVLVLENRKELQITTEDTKYFQTREDATRENRSDDITMKDLIRQCLRKRPDRIIVGEVRGSEAYHALVAWNSGHDGSFCTVHADNAASALDKLEQLAMETGKLSETSVRKLISRSVDIVIQVERLKDAQGARRITEVAQVFHMRKYNRRNSEVANRVAELLKDEENGLVMLADNLWTLPLYELNEENQLYKVNKLIPIQGKE